ncbi:MAG: hypothetical protein K6G78_06975 [bacterium]|nr:hypothetical protein [bacterium]
MAVILAMLSMTTVAFAVGSSDDGENSPANQTVQTRANATPGWSQIDGAWYYFYEDGTMATSRWLKAADGVHWCYVGADGKRVADVWQRDSKGLCYIGSNGYMVADCWASDETGWRWIGSDGYTVELTKWIKIGSSWYHLTNGYRDESAWVRDGHGWCWLQADGAMLNQTRWFRVDGVWYHLTNGYRDQNTWVKDSHGWCYLGEDGAMVSVGWAEDEDGWCWIGEDGYKVEETKWLLVGDTWYHITSGYRDDNKWMKDSKGWCYLGEDGAMVKEDWAEAKKGWCWMDANGYWVNETKWLKVEEVWYHITSGYRDDSKWMKDSKGWCYLGDNGAMVYGCWAKASKGWCWIGSDGYWDDGTKWMKLDGLWYHITSGYRDDSKWVKDSHGWCWMGADGAMVQQTKWFKDRGFWFHITNGYRDVSKWIRDSKGWCYVGADGRMVVSGYSEQLLNLDTGITYESLNITLDEAVDKQYALRPWWGNMDRRATRAEVEYYLDPFNFGLKDWMYLNLQGYTGVTASELNSYLSGMGTLSGTGSAFVSAAKASNINEVYLVAHAKHESALGTSKLASGTYYKNGYFYYPANSSTKVKDKNGNVVKYTKSDGSYYAAGTYYNFFGYGAYDSDPYVFGIEAAVKNGWNSKTKAITGGADKISTQYVNNSYNQNTLYKMRFNPSAMVSGSPAHQYATDIRWAYAQTSSISSIYNQLGGSYDLRYVIPVFK